MKIQDEELANVSGGEVYADGVCTKCGKTFGTSKGLELKVKKNGCSAPDTWYVCDVCGEKVEFKYLKSDVT